MIDSSYFIRKKYPILIILYFLIFIFSNLAFAEPVEIRILHVNDFHGFVDPYKPLGSDKLAGGVYYLAGSIKKLRNEKPTLLLSAGDMIQGSNWANLTEGQSVIELMNEMKFDAMVVGNHEFDFGQEILKKRVFEANFPVLGANVEGLNLLKPYIIKELAGIKIAIIGVTTEDTPTATHPKNVSCLRFLSAIETVEKYLKELKGKAELIIVLSHMGFYADRVLAERVRDIHVIVGGHSHTKIEKPARVNDTIIVQAWEHGKALGVLDLTITNGKIVKFHGYLEKISPENQLEDNSVKFIVDKYSKKISTILDEKIGIALSNLDGENVRKRETNLGNLIADIIRETAGADIAIINGGGIRTGIRKGEIRIKDIYSVLPFNNYIVAIKMSGTKIKEALEHGVSAVEKGAGSFPQVSGIKFIFDAKSEIGNRVKEIFVGDKPIEPDKEYFVATNDFLAAGGDGYTAFGETIKSSKNYEVTGGIIKADNLVYSDHSRYLRDVVVDYIKMKGMIEPKIEGRIKEISGK